MEQSQQLTRRDFIGTAAKMSAVGIAAPYLIKASALGAEGKPPANSRIQLGLIGCNGMGPANLEACAQYPDVVVTGACDVWKQRREAVAAKYKDTCKTYADFRDMLQRPDIDAVIIATPPHWHALIAIAACEAGKDVYLQKPMSLHLGESLAIRNAVQQHNRICQIGTQIHASPNYRNVVELIRAGCLGPVGTVRTFHVMNQGAAGVGHAPDTKVPDGLDWDFWCGPAPRIPYNAILAAGSYEHCSWLAYSGGWTPGMAPHIIDLPVWALDLKYPTEVTSAGGRFIIRDDGDAYDHHEVLWRYPQMNMTWTTALTNSYGFDFHGTPEKERRLGIYFHGVNGTLMANYNEHRIIPEGRNFDPFIKPEVAARKQAKDYTARVQYNIGELQPVARTLPVVDVHEREWLDSIKSRRPPSCAPSYHVRVDVPITLSLLSYRLGRTIKFDPEKERIVGDREAARLAVPEYRRPWRFPKKYLDA